MISLNFWIILGIISIILLIKYWGGFGSNFGPNAVWGGLTLGLIVGFIIAIFLFLQGAGFDWYIIAKAAILGTIIGFIAELLGMINDLLKKKKSRN